MKSAYELALARMGICGDEPRHALTDLQRAELSDIDRRFSARIAERELFMKQEIERARVSGASAAFEEATQALRRERAELEEERELAKDRVRNQDA